MESWDTAVQIGFEGYLLDQRRFQLSRQGRPIVLNHKTFDLLLYLIQRRDRVVSKDELMRDLWPKQVVEESNVTQQIFLLRSALSLHESKAKIVATVPGRGYRFVVDLEYPAAPRAEAPSLAAECSAVRSRWPALATAACVLFGFGGYQLRSWQDRAEGPQSHWFGALHHPGEAGADSAAAPWRLGRR